MAIPTSRAKEPAQIRINEVKCKGCGLCVSVCKDFELVIVDHIVRLSNTPLFGCVGCGHCMAVCPSGAIEIHGRTLSPDQLFDLPKVENTSNYDQLLALLQRRRSIREFKDIRIEEPIIEKILTAAKTAPMGLPPSDVNVLILDGKEQNRDFAEDFCNYLQGMKWLVSKWFLALMRPFWGKENDELFRGFVRPLFQIFTTNIKDGINLVNYDAPLSMYFYGSPYTDPADPIVAATYAMIAAESLGLGTCMIGSVHPLIQSGSKARKFREKYDIKFTSREGVFVLFGYSSIKYNKGLKRTFASVTTHNATGFKTNT